MNLSPDLAPNPCCADCGANPQHKRVPWTPACGATKRMCADCYWLHVESCPQCSGKYKMLPTLEAVPAERAAAAAEAQGEALTGQLLTPAPSISRTTGQMERHSPLFRESSANSQLSLF